MATLPMTKPMVLASLIFCLYTPGALAAQDARSCQNKCAEKMQQCLAKSRMPMSMSNSPADTKSSSKCSDANRACVRACK
jgi:hypothetical protein